MTVIPTNIEQLLLFLVKHRTIFVFPSPGSVFWLTPQNNLGITSDGKFHHILPKNGFLGTKSLYRETRSFDESRNLAPWFQRDAKIMNWTYEIILNHVQYHLLILLPPESVAVSLVYDCPDLELKLRLINHIGWERFLRYKTKIIHQCHDTVLYDIPLRCFVIRVVDATSGKYYYLLVPPTVRTCKEALAWTFGLPANHYRPLFQT